MAASADIARQMQTLAGNRSLQVSVFLPTYSVSQFSAIRPANFDAQPFSIMFAGRIETNKGVYELVKIAQSLAQRKMRRFQIDICGEGPELEALRQKIEGLGLAEFVFCHGFCAQQNFSMILDRAHVVIVPTTAQFEEGFAMICAEAILAGRPVITSAVCPALEYIREAAVEVPPDDVEAYVQAILDLSSDRELFEQKRSACKRLQQQFYEKNNSWGAKLMQELPPNRVA
jgi:glycogen synthase